MARAREFIRLRPEDDLRRILADADMEVSPERVESLEKALLECQGTDTFESILQNYLEEEEEQAAGGAGLRGQAAVSASLAAPPPLPVPHEVPPGSSGEAVAWPSTSSLGEICEEGEPRGELSLGGGSGEETAQEDPAFGEFLDLLLVGMEEKDDEEKDELCRPSLAGLSMPAELPLPVPDSDLFCSLSGLDWEIGGSGEQPIDVADSILGAQTAPGSDTWHNSFGDGVAAASGNESSGPQLPQGGADEGVEGALAADSSPPGVSALGGSSAATSEGDQNVRCNPKKRKVWEQTWGEGVSKARGGSGSCRSKESEIDGAGGGGDGSHGRELRGAENTESGGGEEEEGGDTERRRRRMLRNRASAQLSRQRRKSFVEQLEGRCAALERTVRNLQQAAAMLNHENALLKQGLARARAQPPPGDAPGCGGGGAAGRGAAVQESGAGGAKVEPAVLESDSLPLESLPPHPPHRSPGGRVPTPPPTSSPACSFLPFLCLFSALLCTLWQGAAPALQRPGAQQAAGEEESASLRPEAPPRGGLIPLEPAGRRGRARRRPRRLQTGARPGAGSARHVSSRGLAVTPVAGAAMAAALAAAIELLPLVATPVVGQGKAAPPGVAGWTCARTAARVGGSGSGAGFATVQAAVARAF